MKHHAYVWVRKLRLYGKAPQNSDWYADPECDAAVLGQFNDSVSKIYVVNCVKGKEEQAYRKLVLDLQKEKDSFPNLMLQTALVTRQEYLALVREEDDENV